MIIKKQFYINGEWADPVTPREHNIINPATEEAIATISLGSAVDVDKAVAAAKAAFETYSQTTREERIALLEKIIALYMGRMGEIAGAISSEMGAPMWWASAAQAPSGLGHFMEALKILKTYEFESKIGNSHLVREPIGVCALITPWNWPINQIACKVAPALATGCTMVLKPSELAPLDAMILAEIFHEAGVPKGVFNLVNGDGQGVGVPMSSHRDVDFVSFTGSTRAGIEIAKNAAPTVKRVAQELGGKSPNIILADADIAKAVTMGVRQCFGNSGQSCNAPTRMLVPRGELETAKAAAKAAAESTMVGDPASDAKGIIGPISNGRQYEKVQGMIAQAISEKMEIVAGGIGRPEGFNKGYFARPTVIVSPDNRTFIAQEEVFGPVLTIIPYDSEEEAVAMANDTPYGLAGYVQSGDVAHAKAVAKRIRAGNVHINGASSDLGTPFGGYKQSGTGREWGEFGFEEFLEVKAVSGWGD
ncbi:MAG: aldehyde dehydrogenase (NAD+) [Hyphomonadaceae bacterium]|nr:MAG: aldehyde dehydrogenase (NAD+) [Hyphomonadaceae bacterium]KAF0184727.1 MAG: aldehyde dehydrogenase (NAD+) [Hyphomonadaceae bacterium]